MGFITIATYGPEIIWSVRNILHPMVNVAVVVLDTLRADYFSKHFDWLDGLRFTNAYSTSHWTIPVHASILTGKYASEIGVHAKSITLDCDESTLPESLTDEGITSRLFTANLQIYRWPGWDRGYTETVGPIQLSDSKDNYFDWHEFHRNKGANMSGVHKYQEAIVECIDSDAPTFRSLFDGFKKKILKEGSTENSGDASAILKRIRDTEFGSDEFLMVNLMEAHAPYYPPTEYRTTDKPVDIKTGDSWSDSNIDIQKVKRAYDDSVRYLSDIYKEIFSELSQEFDFIITLSDHGELLGEYGLWAHSYGLSPELTHVPLVISGEDINPEEYDNPVSLIDVHKTVGEFFGVDIESRGMDLLSDNEPTNRLVEYHGFLPWVKDQFERRGISQNLYENFNRNLNGIVTSEGVYGHEVHENGFKIDDASKKQPTRDALDDLLSTVPVRDLNKSTLEIDDKVKNQLKNLGYA